MTAEDSTTSPTESGKTWHESPQRRNTSFKGDVLRLVSGTGIAQIIAVLAAPIFTRLYSPEAFGVAALFVSLTGILGVLACMRYELSIVLPESDREAANLLGGSLCLSLLIALLTVPLVWFAGPLVLQLVKMPTLRPYLLLIPLAVLINGAFIALNYWNTRTKHFTRLSVARVSSSAVSTTATLIAGFVGHATGGAMIAAGLGGQAVSAIVLGGQIWRDNGRFLVQSICWREVLDGLKRHKKFPIYSSWAGLLNTASWQLPVLMLGAFFSPAIVGFYALGFRILQMPMSLIGGAISQVFVQRAVEAKTRGTLGPLVEKIVERLVIVGLFPMLMLTIIGRDLYVVVFGEQWAEAGVYTQILSVWAFFWFISSPLSALFSVMEKQEFSLKINMALFLTRIASLGIGGFFGEERIALLLFATTGIIVYGYLCLCLIAEAEVSHARIWQILQQSLRYFLPFGLCILLLSSCNLEAWVTLLAAFGSAIGYYCLIAWKHPQLLKL